MKAFGLLRWKHRTNFFGAKGDDVIEIGKEFRGKILIAFGAAL